MLTWNLKHGLAVPPAGRELFGEFAAALGGWEWDVALLQEVPPWWPGPLARALGGEERHVLTSRNGLPAIRRAIAVRRPDVIKSNGGGANAILSRGEGITEHRVRRLGWLPERRWVHAVRLGGGVWIGNLHTGASAEQGRAAAVAIGEWSADGPVVLGGDFNVHDLALGGFTLACANGVDQIFVRGLQSDGCAVLDRGRLSDHAPVLASVTGNRG